MCTPKVIAFYLPQFHPFPENDEWWGKGFTEWTNVGKAKPLFKGHNQPRVPTELGYYDLRLTIIREQQAQMAYEAGVTAFCYWHYWFGNGKRLIADIFDEVLNTGKPDFPFCLGWANHSWYAKNWNSDGTSTNKLLIEQTYPGIDDAKKHFDFLLKAFSDPRYVKIDGAPLFFVFAPQDLPIEYIQNFKQWTKKAGFPDLFMVANITGDNRKPPFMVDYSKVFHTLITKEDYEENVIPAIVPQWDHTPRSGWNGTLFINAKPEYFYEHAKDALNAVRNKKNPIIFLKSWNEWGEGNMMEPDLTYGRGFINALRKAIDEF